MKVPVTTCTSGDIASRRRIGPRPSEGSWTHSTVRVERQAPRAEAVQQGFVFRCDDGDHAVLTEPVAIRTVKHFGARR